MTKERFEELSERDSGRPRRCVEAKPRRPAFGRSSAARTGGSSAANLTRRPIAASKSAEWENTVARDATRMKLSQSKVCSFNGNLREDAAQLGATDRRKPHRRPRVLLRVAAQHPEVVWKRWREKENPVARSSRKDLYLKLKPISETLSEQRFA